MTDNIRLKVWQCLSAYTPLEDEFPNASLETRTAVRVAALELWMRYNDKKLHLQDTLNRILEVAVDDDEVEELIANHPEHAALQEQRNSIGVDSYVWAAIKPEEN